MTPTEAHAEALLVGWDGMWRMDRVLTYARLLAGLPAAEGVALYTPACAILKVKHISAGTPCRAFVEQHYGALSESLWDGRSTERCRALALKALGKKTAQGSMRVGTRAQDKRHDWRTVK